MILLEGDLRHAVSGERAMSAAVHPEEGWGGVVPPPKIRGAPEAPQSPSMHDEDSACFSNSEGSTQGNATAKAFSSARHTERRSTRMTVDLAEYTQEETNQAVSGLRKALLMDKPFARFLSLPVHTIERHIVDPHVVLAGFQRIDLAEFEAGKDDTLGEVALQNILDALTLFGHYFAEERSADELEALRRTVVGEVGNSSSDVQVAFDQPDILDAFCVHLSWEERVFFTIDVGHGGSRLSAVLRHLLVLIINLSIVCYLVSTEPKYNVPPPGCEALRFASGTACQASSPLAYTACMIESSRAG